MSSLDAGRRPARFALRLPDEDSAAHYRALCEGAFADGSAGRIVFCVYTSDLAEGRGDIYVAAGLGRALVNRGWGVRFLPRDRWGEAIDDADAVVAMLPSYDPAPIPESVPVIGWVRNEVEVWAGKRDLTLFDMLLCSSALSHDHLTRVYRGPTDLLPIGVDHDLFRPGPAEGRTLVTTTVNHWGRDRDLHRALTEVAVEGDPEVVWYADPKRLSSPLRDVCAGMVSYFALPEAYQRSLLVLDDMNHTTLPYGCVNSRVYEALACGALPVTNGALGLAELGLQDVPVYRSGRELREIIEQCRHDRVATRERAQRLREVVLERHSFAVRAEAFISALGRARDSAARPRRSIFFVPDYAGNPYQRLLYGHCASAGLEVTPVTDHRSHLTPRDSGGSLEDRVLHVHWTSPIVQSAAGPFDGYRRLDRFITAIQDFRDRGGRLMWTVHNVLPHECRLRSLELELRRFLAESADVIHVLGESTREAVRAYYDLPPEKVRTIPHCSYLGVYPDFIGRDEARRRLGIQPSEVVLTTFGAVRMYKGLGTLLTTLDRAVREDPRLRLAIAGRPVATPEVKQWCEQAADHPRVVSQFDFVDDAEVQIWMQAADLALLPYTSTLNSGALHLALSFGLPVIGPADGVVGTQLGSAYAESFRPGDQDSLLAAIHGAVARLRTPQAAEAARHAAAQYPPEAMARDFAQLACEQFDGCAP